MAIATKHEKESVMAPILESGIGVRCMVPAGIDTDLLGTFSGEVERPLNPLATARAKCNMAMDLTGCDLAIASEGSFGPHPHLIYAAADDEIIVLVDRKHNLEIVVREVTTETNFQGMKVETEQELREFADAALFPTHALIVKKSQHEHFDAHKGVTDWTSLRRIFRQYRVERGSVWVETDMRAMFNPTRMRVIAAATEKLLAKAISRCPSCGVPGFGATEAKSGLPCSLCHLPTQSTLAHIYQCQKCNHQVEWKFPHGKQEEDPRYCDYCNP